MDYDDQKRHVTPYGRLLRLKQVLGDKKANPPIPAILPISRSKFYNGVKNGLYPPPKKHLGPKTSAWDLEEIWAVVEGRDWREVARKKK